MSLVISHWDNEYNLSHCKHKDNANSAILEMRKHEFLGEAYHCKIICIYLSIHLFFNRHVGHFDSSRRPSLQHLPRCFKARTPW